MGTEAPKEGSSKLDRWALGLAVISLVISAGLAFEPPPVRDLRNNFFSSFVPNVNDLPLPPETMNVQTSGYRKDRDGSIWSGANLVDQDPSTAWSECATTDLEEAKEERRNPCEEPPVGTSTTKLCADPHGFADKDIIQGIGEWVELTLATKTKLKAVSIRNGNQKTDQTFLRNPRVETLTVQADGKVIKDLELRDEKGPQRFPLETSATKIRFIIKKTYLGECLPVRSGDGQLPYFYDASLAEIALVPAKAPGNSSQ